ncbi:hypothetical protein [Sphingomonas sp.]
MRRDTKIDGHLLRRLMVQAALEAFPLGYRQAQNRCARALVYRVHPHGS